MKRKLLKLAKNTKAQATVALLTVASNASALDGTEGDAAMADIGVMGGIMVALTLAVTGYSYVKRTAR